LAITLAACTPATGGQGTDADGESDSGEAGSTSTSTGSTADDTTETSTTESESQESESQESESQESESQESESQESESQESEDTGPQGCVAYEAEVQLELDGEGVPPCGPNGFIAKIASVDGETISFQNCQSCGQCGNDDPIWTLEVSQPDSDAEPVLGSGTCVEIRLTSEGQGPGCHYTRLDVSLPSTDELLYSTGSVIAAASETETLVVEHGVQHDSCTEVCADWTLYDLNLTLSDDDNMTTTAVTFETSAFATLSGQDYKLYAWASWLFDPIDCGPGVPPMMVSWTVLLNN